MRGMIAIGQERVRFSMGRKLVFDIGLAFNLVVRARFSYKMQYRFLMLTFKVHSKYIEYVVLLHMINRLSAVTLHF